MGSAIVLYAIDENPLYHLNLKWSLCSLRNYSKLPVVVCIFGAPTPDLRNLCAETGAQLIECRTVSADLRWGLKWLALREVLEAKRVLFVDADTFFFGPIDEVFEKCRSAEFYAVREFGTDPESKFYRGLSRKRVNLNKLRHLQKQFQADAYPIFNSSFMLFNRSSHRKVVARLGDIVELVQLFYSDDRRNPIYPRWRFMAEEVAGSIALGLRRPVSFGFLPGDLVSHYNWWVRLGRGRLANCLHIGGDHGSQAMREFGCPEEANTWLRLYVRKRQAVAPILRLLPSAGLQD